MTPVINDLADDLLAGTQTAEIVTQATAELDTMPAPYAPASDQDDEAETFAGLNGNPRSRLARGKGVRQAHLQARRTPAPIHAGFLPGMGDDEDLSGPGGTMKRRAKVHAAQVGPRPTRVARPAPKQRIHAGFLPGMGDVGTSPSVSAPLMIGLGALAVYFLFFRK